MKVSEYANDVNLSVAEILKKCHELAINVNNKDDYLTDDDIIMLDNMSVEDMKKAIEIIV